MALPWKYEYDGIRLMAAIFAQVGNLLNKFIFSMKEKHFNRKFDGLWFFHKLNSVPFAIVKNLESWKLTPKIQERMCTNTTGMDAKKPALGGLQYNGSLAAYAFSFFANLRRDAAKPSRPRPSKATVAGSGTSATCAVKVEPAK